MRDYFNCSILIWFGSMKNELRKMYSDFFFFVNDDCVCVIYVKLYSSFFFFNSSKLLDIYNKWVYKFLIL